ncbi:PX domain-containing EREL1-like isoform X3 [Olea europaea subsp. europaea]|uniref:PX domain-containing EREL1-like isoform X3 n=1 Tax=Olea europaea subsp. europaea TaxID=158383 RepID=A0A8S0SAA6_OLEEU|nr:PX domain-containing EREL1-like isoform X3 [Olea europaea subsp. europaea]
MSAPKHRHDGTSPLPLGMDWSPPPRNWVGSKTIWPHDPRTGWSYCVTIPSWVVLAKSRDSDPIVFYRVMVGIQSPAGITTTRTVLRRFNDFLKLHAARRNSLEEWMARLLSDIDLSRSTAFASFLELEAAARSSFQEDGQNSPDSNITVTTAVQPLQFHPNSSLSVGAGSSALTSDYGSDTAYETSEIGTPSHGRDNSEIGTEDLSLDDDLTSPMDKFVKYGMSNIDEGLSMGQAILEQLEKFPKHKLYAKEIHSNVENNNSNGGPSRILLQSGDMSGLLSEQEHGAVGLHNRKVSSESIGSDRSSQRGSTLSNSAISISNGYAPVDIYTGAEASRNIGTLGNTDFQLPDDVQLVLPMDQRQKMNRVVMLMQRRLVAAKTDMEDLISRLNQEIAVKDYLATKVKDLEGDLETTKRNSKDNLEQAILIERERVTQMQWDMEELRRRSMEMELKLSSQQGQKLDKISTKASVSPEKDALQQDLDSTKRQLEELLKKHQELEVKSKADIKVLVKEVKSLRNSQVELKQQLSQSLNEKSEAEELLQKEIERTEQARTSWRKLLHKCKILHNQLQECQVDVIHKTGDNLVVDIPSDLNALDRVATSDNHIGLLIEEAQHLAENADYSSSTFNGDNNLDDNTSSVDEELRRMLMTFLIDNGVLRKQVNSTIYALQLKKSLEKGDCEPPSDVNVQNEVSQ